MSIMAVMLLLVPVLPGLLAVVTLAFHQRRLGGLLAIPGAIPGLVVGLYPSLSQDVSYPWLLLGTRLGINDVDAIFLLFTAVVWLVASGFAFGWIRHGPGRERFFAVFLLTMSGNLGALVAQDMPSFYAMFALMSFGAYGLIAHSLTREARHAGSVYIVLVMVGEAALAMAMILAAGAVGSSDFAAVQSGLHTLPSRHLIIALAFLGFGIKAGVLVLHVWLPLAHPVAPAPASAVLSGTIIVTGLVGWLRFLPIGECALPGWGGMCIGLGLTAAFYGAIIGIDQREPKVLLAYSSISQMGIMTVALGMMLVEPSLSRNFATAIAYFALHHGLAKSALFLGAGLGKRRMRDSRRRWLVIGLALPSLALAGAPFTSGMVAKSALIAGETLLPQPWASGMRFLLPLTSIATALLMARFMVLVARHPVAEKDRAGTGPYLIWCFSVVLVLFLPLWLTPVAGFSLTVPTLIESFWPLAAALALALVAIRTWRRVGRPQIPEIPAGDMLLPMERLVHSLRKFVSSIARRLRLACRRKQRTMALGRRYAWTLIQTTSRTEAALGRWRVALTLALLLGTALALLASW